MAASFEWRAGDGTPPPPDPVRTKRMRSERLEKVERAANKFFARLYTETARQLTGVEGAAHTGQIPMPAQSGEKKRPSVKSTCFSIAVANQQSRTSTLIVTLQARGFCLATISPACRSEPLFLWVIANTSSSDQGSWRSRSSGLEMSFTTREGNTVWPVAFSQLGEWRQGSCELSCAMRAVTSTMESMRWRTGATTADCNSMGSTASTYQACSR